MAEHVPGHTPCSACKNRRAAVPLPVIRVAPLASAGVLEAVMSHEANRQSNLAFERQQMLEGEPFVRPPHHFDWCAEYTLTDEQCARIAAALRRGDAGPAEEAQDAGYELDFDPVNGRVVRYYALCVVKNVGRCDGFITAQEGMP